MRDMGAHAEGGHRVRLLQLPAGGTASWLGLCFPGPDKICCHFLSDTRWGHPRIGQSLLGAVVSLDMWSSSCVARPGCCGVSQVWRCSRGPSGHTGACCWVMASNTREPPKVCCRVMAPITRGSPRACRQGALSAHTCYRGGFPDY